MMTRCNYSVQTALRSLDPDGAMEVWLGCNGVMSGDSLPLGCVWILRGFIGLHRFVYIVLENVESIFPNASLIHLTNQNNGW